MTADNTSKIIPVLLSGGQGTRLWPLSRAAWPKQFLPLAGEQSLFEDSLKRIADDALFGRPIVICAHDHRFIIRDMLRAHNMDADLILEPCGRNTAPALCAAALAARARGDERTPMLAMPVDHYIPDTQDFRDCVQSALPACEARRIVLFGIRATSAHTGFGYIRQGPPWDDNAALYEIAEFREKPDSATAQSFVASGDYAWNAGIFLMSAGDYLDELAQLAPQVHKHASAAWRNAGADLEDIVLDGAHFRPAPSISIDHAVLERSTKPCVIPADFEWDDLGSWDALMDLAPKDAQGTVRNGNVMAEDVHDSYLQSTGPLLRVSNIDNIIAVATSDAVLVTRRGQERQHHSKNMMQQHTALVLGAGGFIASHLVKRLKDDGYWVRGVDLKYPEFATTQADDFVIGDLRDMQFCCHVLDMRFDEIYQFAADMGGAGFIFTGRHDAGIMTNSAKINLNILEAAHKCNARNIFYASSACIYPERNQADPDQPVTAEDSAYPAAPDSEYGWEKLFSERLFLSYARNHDFRVRIARYHNIFGPEGTWQGGREKAPAALCRKVANATRPGEAIEIWGDGQQTRSFLYIDECIEGTLRLMRSAFTGPVNIGSEEMVSINQLGQMIIDISGKDLQIRNVPAPTGVRGRNSDNRLIREKLGWEPQQALYEGLKPTYRWIEQQVMGNTSSSAIAAE